MKADQTPGERSRADQLVEWADREFNEATVDELVRDARARLDRSLQRIGRPRLAIGVVESALGELLLAASPRGLVLNHFLDDTSDLAAIIAGLRRDFDPVEDRPMLAPVGAEIRHYLAGDATALRYPVDLALVSNPYQRKVLHKLMAVPRGAVVSYGALSASAGAPRGARAAGNALHNNPVPIYVPCHRVIASAGGIGGYGGGLARKRQLLRAEGFAFDRTGMRLGGEMVWGHRGTKIYCKTTCRMAARVDRTRIMFFCDAAEARRAGLRACKLCRPA